MKINFNIEEFKPTKTGGFKPLPNGEHTFIIEEIFSVESKKGIEMYKGVFKEPNTGINVHFYFLINHQGIAGESGKRNLSQLFYFTGTSIENADTDQLLGKKVNAITKINENGYNEIKAFRAASDDDFTEEQLPF